MESAYNSTTYIHSLRITEELLADSFWRFISAVLHINDPVFLMLMWKFKFNLGFVWTSDIMCKCVKCVHAGIIFLTL